MKEPTYQIKRYICIIKLKAKNEMKSNNGILTEKEIQARTRFWNKKQFRTWSKKELERTSTDMQKLLVAIKRFSMDKIKAIRKLDWYGSDLYYRKRSKYIVRMADQRDLDYAISIAPKTFKVKQG
jgi:hypothetical protein